MMNPAATLVLAASLTLAGCAASTHATQPSPLGAPRSSADMLAVVDQPGPIALTTIDAADWRVARSGLVDLHDPRAKELTDGDEPIQIYFHVVRHPTRGTFIVDTGVERALRDDPAHAAIRGLVGHYMHTDKMQIHVALGDWLLTHHLDGVFLTHMHLDHVSGMPDVPRGTPIYVGPGETEGRQLLNLFVRPNIDRAMQGQAAVSEWPFRGDADGRFAGVVDVFGDGTFWAIYTPGHTPGSTAYLARTPSGPVLLTGDTCHTAWGWEHDVAPGSFTADHQKNADSLARLEKLVAEHPRIEVRLGHQRLDAQQASR